MCFSNLPVEFDEAGNPYLAEEADEVDRPELLDAGEEAAIEVDPGEAYEAIVESLPPAARTHLEAGTRDGPTAVDPEPAEEAHQ